MTIVLLGASGFTGALTAAALDRRGIAFVAAGRDVDKVARAVEGCSHVTDVRRGDVSDPVSLRGLFDGAAVVVTTVGPFERLGRPVLEAAVDAGCHYVDSTGEQSFMRWAFDEVGAAADAAGITAIPACGFDYVPGDLLSDVAADAVGATAEVHVAYLVRGRGNPLGWMSKGTRTTIADVAVEPGVSLVDGELVAERLGDARRLAWFPRPVGPRHAVGLPAGEPLTVPRHVPGVRTVRTYMAVPGALAEAVQFGANIGRLAPIRAITSRVMRTGAEGPDEERRASTRWACVAEASTADGAVARAWANGVDPYGFTGEVLAAAATRLAAGEARATGVVAPAEAFDARDLLDDLAENFDIRWSVTPPTA